LDAEAQVEIALALATVYGTLLAVGVISTALRVAQFRRSARPAPRLLGRDFVLLAGHALSFGVVVATRAADADYLWSTPLWWAVAGGVPIAALAVYVYYEIRVIGH
jgi:protein-S-isoprenylcysteine O-methyltransferase Ste14